MYYSIERKVRVVRYKISYFFNKKQIVKCDFIPQFRLLQQMQVKLLLLTCYANCKNISQFWVSSELQESQILERIHLRC